MRDKNGSSIMFDPECQFLYNTRTKLTRAFRSLEKVV